MTTATKELKFRSPRVPDLVFREDYDELYGMYLELEKAVMKLEDDKDRLLHEVHQSVAVSQLELHEAGLGPKGPKYSDSMRSTKVE